MPSSPIVLVLGAGPNIGQSVARAFAAKGYRIAIASRKATGSPATSPPPLQSTTRFPRSRKNSAFPASSFTMSCGVKNIVASATPNPPKDPLSVSLSDFTKDLTINTISAFAAAQAAVQGFAQLPDTASRTFIYTGNILNTDFIIPPLLDLGVGKSATARIIHYASTAYKEKGFKFYYADERKEDGSAAYGDIDGDAHAAHYVQLAEGNSQGPWQQTFVKGVGYKVFPE